MILAILSVAALILVWVIVAYNSLVKGSNMVKEGWSGIDVQLKRRSSLIPNLIESVKGYMGHEQQLLMDITELRGESMKAKSVEEKAKAEDGISRSLVNLFAVAENYPNLKANENFINLQQELSKTEDELQLSRRYYNGAVRNFNTSIESFPTNIIANMFHFTMAPFFEIENPEERETPKVKF